jgi:hypothetical protein
MPTTPAASHCHGTRGNPEWAAPQLARASSETARPGYGTVSADEYADEPPVLRAKVKLLASMIRSAKHACAYTGAGISTVCVFFTLLPSLPAAKRPSLFSSGGQLAVVTVTTSGPFNMASFLQQQRRPVHRCRERGHAGVQKSGVKIF